MNSLRSTLVLSLLLTVAACSKKEQQSLAPTDEGQVAVTSSSALSGRKLFQTYCSACHGAEGKGDGPAARALSPAPRDLGDAAFQAGLTEDSLRRVITLGGAAVGKSAGMPPAPQLAGDPEKLDAVVGFVRSLRR